MTSLPLFDAPILTDAKPPKLRPYQERAIVSLRARILLNEKRILAVGSFPLASHAIVVSGQEEYYAWSTHDSTSL